MFCLFVFCLLFVSFELCFWLLFVFHVFWFSKRHASWAVMKAEDFEEDCLTSTESNKEFFTAFKLKTVLVGEKIQKEYSGGFCAVLPPGSYKLVLFFVSPTKGTKVVHIPSAVSFVGKKKKGFSPPFFLKRVVVTACKSWESFKCVRCWAPSFNVNSKVSIEVAYEPQSSGQVLEVKVCKKKKEKLIFLFFAHMEIVEGVEPAHCRGKCVHKGCARSKCCHVSTSRSS